MEPAAFLKRAILDLRKIQAFCIHENLDEVPGLGTKYLEVNSKLLRHYVTELYATTTREQQRVVYEDNTRLDQSAIENGFGELAMAAFWVVDNPDIMSLTPTTPDDLRMLIRALDFAVLFPITPPDLPLRMSPIDQHGLKNYLVESAAPGKPIDTIPWETADALYVDAKVAAFDECRVRGLEMTSPRDYPRAANFPAAVDEGSRILMTLLRTKVEADLGLVLIVAGDRRAQYDGLVASRLNSEFLNLLDAIRDALVHLVECFAPLTLRLRAGEELTPLHKMSVDIEVQNALKPLLKQFDSLKKQVPIIQPNPNVVQRLHRLRAQSGGVTIMGDVFQNIKESTIVNRSIVERWSQQQEGVDFSTLRTELAKLRAALLEQAKTPEECMVLGQVAAAEGAATEGDAPRVLQYLKTAGEWALKVATEIGAKIAAETIGKAMGMK